MDQFPHLKFIQKLVGKPRLFGGNSPNPTTDNNRRRRRWHSTNLAASTTKIKADWNKLVQIRKKAGLAPLDKEIIPVFLQINPDILNAEFDLHAFGIEIISEENDGFIVGASVDNLISLEEKISQFITNARGSAKIADFWKIIDGNREEWKPKHILSDSLFEKWPNIEDDKSYSIEVSIAFDAPLGEEPDSSKRGGATRLAKYRNRVLEREDLLMRRHTHFENFIRHYGNIISGFVELSDCFGCEVNVTGKGLKDLVVNYPFVFEVNELEEIGGVIGGESQLEEDDLEVIPPMEGSPLVGVIDSGFMENHRYLSPAVDHGNSKSYILHDASTADHVAGGGHGTRVAGAILYPLGVSKYESPYQLPCFIRNLRILNGDNQLLHRYPSELIQEILRENPECSIYNLSVNSIRKHRKRHMSTWAASIDKEIFERNTIFVVSAGNISRETIREYIQQGVTYPYFLKEAFCAIANPGQSCFSITVGSVNHATFNNDSWQSLGNEKEISAFSRIGPGIWKTIKPDVVEYGGGVVISKNGHNHIKESDATAPELLRSTLHGGSFNGFDAVGTSFAAPKVTHILSNLKQLYPDETINLLRALLVQGARLPGNFFNNPTNTSLQFFGFGMPSLDRVTKNTEHRISFYNTGELSAEAAHMYSLKIPKELRSPGDDYDILIEVTLAYTAKVRRTRQKIKSYLSTWLDWTNSKLGEPFEKYKEFALKNIDGTVTEYDKEERKLYDDMNWKIGERSNSGDVEFSRGNNSIQKDWAIIKSHELPEEITFVVRGHKGWDKNKDEVPYAFVVSLEILGNNIPIYESIKIQNEIAIENEIN